MKHDRMAIHAKRRDEMGRKSKIERNIIAKRLASGEEYSDNSPSFPGLKEDICAGMGLRRLEQLL